MRITAGNERRITRTFTAAADSGSVDPSTILVYRAWCPRRVWHCHGCAREVLEPVEVTYADDGSAVTVVVDVVFPSVAPAGRHVVRFELTGPWTVSHEVRFDVDPRSAPPPAA